MNSLLTAATDARYKIWFGEHTLAHFGEVIRRMAPIRTVL